MPAKVISKRRTVKRKKRLIGLEKPFALEQQFTWIVQVLNTTLFYVIASLYLNNDNIKTICIIIYSGLLLLAIIMWCYLSLVDPATNVDESTWFCPCMRKSQESARFCQVCKKTTIGLDHHCVWLNTCVGKKNYPHFYILILTFSIQYSLQLYMGVRLYFDWGPISKDITFYIVNTLHMIAISGVWLGFMALWLFHCYLLILGFGTYDFIANKREREMEEKRARDFDPEKERIKQERITKKKAAEREMWLREHGNKLNKNNATTTSNDNGTGDIELMPLKIDVLKEEDESTVSSTTSTTSPVRLYMSKTNYVADADLIHVIMPNTESIV